MAPRPKKKRNPKCVEEKSMKLSELFVTFHTDDEAMLVAVGGANFSGLVRGSEAFGDILELLKEDVSEEALIAAMADRYDAPLEVLTRDVRDALARLRDIGAVVD